MGPVCAWGWGTPARDGVRTRRPSPPQSRTLRLWPGKQGPWKAEMCRSAWAGRGEGGKRLGRCLSPVDAGLQPSGSPLPAWLYPLGSGQNPGGGGSRRPGHWRAWRASGGGGALGGRRAPRWASGLLRKASATWLHLQSSAPRPEHRSLGSALSLLGGAGGSHGRRELPEPGQWRATQGKPAPHGHPPLDTASSSLLRDDVTRQAPGAVLTLQPPY